MLIRLSNSMVLDNIFFTHRRYLGDHTGAPFSAEGGDRRPSEAEELKPAPHTLALPSPPLIEPRIHMLSRYVHVLMCDNKCSNVTKSTLQICLVRTCHCSCYFCHSCVCF